MIAGTLIALLMTVAAPKQGLADLEAAIGRVRVFAVGVGEELWPGYGTAPFDILMLDADQEILLCRTPAPDGFAPAGRSDGAGCDRHRRPRGSLPAGLLAAMPLFGPPSTIVMGTPASTGKSKPVWVRTMLHEHFHQWQTGLPGYFERVRDLDLAGGDETGMWQLTFAFPYSRSDILRSHADAAIALDRALEARRSAGFGPALDRYLAARERFRAAAGERNWRYAEFQYWQEGVARWAEIRLGQAYPDPAVAAAAAALERATRQELRAPDIAARGREFAYAFGAGEAMLLEACGRAWQQRYREVLALGPLLREARRTCPGT